MKRYKSATILRGGPLGKIVQCQSFFYKTKTYTKILTGFYIELCNIHFTSNYNSLKKFIIEKLLIVRDLLTGAVIDSFQSDCFRTLIAIPQLNMKFVQNKSI